MRKALSLILVFVLCLGLCACGENNKANTTEQVNDNNGISNIDSETLNMICGEWKKSPEGHSNSLSYETIIIEKTGTCYLDGVQAEVKAEGSEIYILCGDTKMRFILNSKNCADCLGDGIDYSTYWKVDFDYAISQFKEYLEYDWVLLPDEEGKLQHFEQNQAAQKLYETFSSFSDHDLSKEILNRFYIVENVLLESSSSEVDAFGQTVAGSYSITQYFYNKDGLLSFLPNNHGPDSHYTYDEQGRLVKETGMDSDEIIQFVTSYTYDDNNLIQKETKESSGNIYKEVYTYDEQNNLILREEIEENSSGIYKDKYEMTYDEYGRIQTSTFDHGKTVYAYNDKGLLISKETTFLGDVFVETYSYDEQGLLMEQFNKRINNSYNTESTTKITYTYENGNLVQKVTEDGTKIIENYIYGTQYAFDTEGLVLP